DTIYGDDDWLSQANLAAETSVNKLVEEFVALPYLHRVEHSMHTRLTSLLSATPTLGHLVPLGDGRTVTQVVQKEYPETLPRPEKGNRRGNFDVVVLSPRLLSGASLSSFLQGRIPGSIVIEMGLDYDFHHLSADCN